ncbi:hypothetical protein GDO86_014006 [Hymenochirus boettgeri]|uniref:UBX domain-containing protein n=1 Tax=Hymenochirus boettgeri TaxID=247094 RepID=A0A8T2JSD3_9PIPI|nr:hypothetical protein GDO86_014006 [Hymenochirus boettgeri]
MASGGQGVSVLAPNGRRQTVKVTAGTTLLQVLEEVCRKQKFNASEYNLKFQRTVLDLSLQWRFANLPNNAKLEMVSCTQQRAAAESMKVRVALQLEEGMRLQGEFLSNQTLMDVLVQFPETRERLEQVPSGFSPVCIYMRDEVMGESAFKDTTLQSLGLTGGSAIIRYALRRLDQEVKREHQGGKGDLKTKTAPVFKEISSIQEARKKPSDHEEIKESPQISAVQPSVDAKVSISEPCSTSCDKEAQKQIMQNSEKSCTLPSTFESDGVTAHCSNFIPFQGGGHRLGGANLPAGLPEVNVPFSTSQGHIQSPGPSKPKKSKTEGGRDEDTRLIERDPLVCHMDMDPSNEPATRELPEDFFEVTVDDVRRRFAELRSERQRLEEAPLMTKALREAQMKEKLEKYPKVVLRVLFPDRYILQGFFHPTEKVSAVKEFVRIHLEDSQIPFYLFTTPPRIELDNAQTLFQANLFPAALVHFGSMMQREHFLSQRLLKAPVSPSEADILVARSMPHIATVHGPTIHEGFVAVREEETQRPQCATETNEECICGPQQAVQMDPGKVPKWLKLPGKK